MKKVNPSLGCTSARGLCACGFYGILLTLSRTAKTSGGRHGLKRRVIVLAGAAMFFAVQLHAEETPVPSVAEQVKQLQRSSLAPRHQESQERRLAAAGRHSANNLHQYRSVDGTITFTNRPEKYDTSARYERIEIKYDPISVPKAYQKMTKTSRYASSSVRSLVERYASNWHLDPDLVLAVIKRESNFNADAVSSAGACGLMQLMPGTAQDMGVTDIFDPAQNIAGGTQYLAKMLELFNGDIRLALAGYNAGPENVKKYGGIPPFEETKNYVRLVMQEYTGIQSGGDTYRNSYYAKVRGGTASTVRRPVAPNPGRFVVHFHSGLTQAADKVTDKDPYYYIEYRNRTYPVRKDLVAKIENGA